MCIIIDANVSHQIAPPSVDARPVVDWLESRSGLLVIGGRNTDELIANSRVARWLRSLQQAGRVRVIRCGDLDAEEVALLNLALCVSNDLHILALARLSGARLVYSNDQDLHTDFRNPALISRPRGKVYQVAGHRHLLRLSACRSSS